MAQQVLFDLDGTLTDSAPGITRCLAHAVRAVGGTPPALEALRPWIGTPLREIFRGLLEHADGERIEEAVAAYVERFDQKGFYESSLFPGIIEALEALRDAGCELHVATAKGQHTAELVVEHFGLSPLFRFVFGSRLERGIVSKQDVLGYGLEEGAISVSNATMVGDRDHDIHAAHSFGVQAIGVSWGYGPIAELESAHAIVHAPGSLASAIVRSA